MMVVNVCMIFLLLILIRAEWTVFFGGLSMVAAYISPLIISEIRHDEPTFYNGFFWTWSTVPVISALLFDENGRHWFDMSFG